MQTEAAPQTDSEQLLVKKTNPKRQWSSIQVIFMIVLAIIITAILSNIDRIIDATKSNTDNSPSYKFGHSARAHFALDDELLEFNFGAYGNAPREVIKYQQEIRYEIESCPTCWMRSIRESSLNQLLQRLAEYLGIKDWTDLAFVINASHGMNAVLRSITQTLYNDKCSNNRTTCKVLQFNTAYPMVKNTINFINNDTASNVDQMIEFTVTIDMLSNTDLLIQELDTFINETLSETNITIYLASISHIASLPAVLYDAKRINELFRSYDIITLIDAAHVIGAIDVNITDLNPDIWIANGHKWLYSTRGSAVIYVKKEYHDLIFPVVISSEYGESLQQRFNYQGTMDDSIWMSMNAALDFRDKFGENNIIKYIHNICVEGGNIMNELWNTGLLIDNEENYGSMINPILPTTNTTEITIISSKLFNEYNVIVQTAEFQGSWYLRLCCQIYHNMDDFKWIANAVLDILKDVRS